MKEEATTVVSALVRDFQAGPSRDLLMGVRRPVLTSERHPGVLSTLTMRVPVAVFQAAVEEAAGTIELPQYGGSFRFRNPAAHPFGVPNAFASLGAFLMESLLARKVEVGSRLVLGEIAGMVSPLGVAAELVEDPRGGFGPEPTQMLTYEVSIERGREFIPATSASYNPLRWVDARDLASALGSNDALLLLPDADPFEVCIHGLCVRSASDFLELDRAQ